MRERAPARARSKKNAFVVTAKAPRPCTVEGRVHYNPCRREGMHLHLEALLRRVKGQELHIVPGAICKVRLEVRGAFPLAGPLALLHFPLNFFGGVKAGHKISLSPQPRPADRHERSRRASSSCAEHARGTRRCACRASPNACRKWTRPLSSGSFKQSEVRVGRGKTSFSTFKIKGVGSGFCQLFHV